MSMDESRLHTGLGISRHVCRRRWLWLFGDDVEVQSSVLLILPISTSLYITRGD